MNRLSKLITITPTALKELKKINNKKYIKYGIKSGGCSGFQYILEICDTPINKNQELIVEKIENEEIKIKIDNQDLMMLLGTEIDWEDNIMGKRFVFKNPNADFTCGCGKSFG